MQPSSSTLPRVTLVVPNYNHAQYLPVSLGSVAAQTAAPNRVLIIDDASNDDSLEVISQFITRHSNWELIRHDQNRGVVSGQNEAIRLVDTEWISFLGADDALHPSYLAQVLKQAAAFPNAGLICGCSEILDGSNQRKLRPMMLPQNEAGFLPPDRMRSILLAGDNYFSGTVTLFRREALVAMGGFDVSLGSIADSLLARQLSLTCGFVFLPEILGYWRIHGQNYSMTSLADPVALSERLAEVRKRIDQGQLFPPGYADLFDRRTRFGSARQVIASQQSVLARATQASALLGSAVLDKIVLLMLLALGELGRIGALAWITLRTRPMSLTRLLLQRGRRRSIIAAREAYRPS